MGRKEQIPAFDKKQIAFIYRNHTKMTNAEFAKHFGLQYCNFCARKCRLGIRNMEMEYWTPAQIKYLLKWYALRGDKELAEMFSKRWHKNKGWTLKHIEKKRMYLKLKRTREQICDIKAREVKKGTYIRASKKTWATRGTNKNGTIVKWKSKYGQGLLMIKINGKYTSWARWYWRKHRGAIPKKMNIVFKDGNLDNQRISNLIMITNGQLSKRNSKISSQGLSDNYVAGVMSHGNNELRKVIKQVPEFIEMKRNQLLLNRSINETFKTQRTA